MGKRRSALAPKEVPPEAELPADVLATEEDFTVFFFYFVVLFCFLPRRTCTQPGYIVHSVVSEYLGPKS